PPRAQHAGPARPGHRPRGRARRHRGRRPPGPRPRLDHPRALEDDQAPARPAPPGGHPGGADREAAGPAGGVSGPTGPGGLTEGDREMDGEAFVKELDAENQELLRRLTPDATLRPEVEGDLTGGNLRKVALEKE